MYLIHKWNKKYGNAAKFVVENHDNGEFTEFSPVSPNDVAWVKADLTKNSEYKAWDDFQKEPVEDLNMIVM